MLPFSSWHSSLFLQLSSAVAVTKAAAEIVIMLFHGDTETRIYLVCSIARTRTGKGRKGGRGRELQEFEENIHTLFTPQAHTSQLCLIQTSLPNTPCTHTLTCHAIVNPFTAISPTRQLTCLIIRRITWHYNLWK